MKRGVKKSSLPHAIGLALTWDGARWSAGRLPPKARAFLAGHTRELPSAAKMAALLAYDELQEIRVCWVPRLKGGKDVLSDSFPTKSGKRLAFKATKTARFGNVLGVIYRRS